MKFLSLILLLMTSLAYNPWSGEFRDCVVMRINDSSVTLWEIQKVVVLDLIFRGIAPEADVVEGELSRNWEKYRNFFIIRCELDRIQYNPIDRAAFQQTAIEKVKKLNNSMLAYLKLYSISITDAASFLFEKYRMRSYYQNFLYQLIEVKDEEIREYYEKNKDRFKGLSFESVKEKISSLLLFQKKRRRLDEYISRLIRTETVEVFFPDLNCKTGGGK